MTAWRAGGGTMKAMDIDCVPERAWLQRAVMSWDVESTF